MDDKEAYKGGELDGIILVALSIITSIIIVFIVLDSGWFS